MLDLIHVLFGNPGTFGIFGLVPLVWYLWFGTFGPMGSFGAGVLWCWGPMNIAKTLSHPDYGAKAKPILVYNVCLTGIDLCTECELVRGLPVRVGEVHGRPPAQQELHGIRMACVSVVYGVSKSFTASAWPVYQLCRCQLLAR